MNKLQVVLSGNRMTAPVMRCLAYFKNDVFGSKFIDLLLPKLLPGWKEMKILDLGSGPCNMERDNRFRGVDITCFDIYEPYLKTCKNHGLKTVKGDALEVQKYFPAKSFDIVWMFDVIEHFPKKQGLGVLSQAEKLAKKQVIVWVPYGFYPQDYDVVKENWPGADKKLLSHNTNQQHKSAWYPVDFTKRGYKVEVLHNYHPDIRHGARKLLHKKEPVRASQMWAIKLRQ